MLDKIFLGVFSSPFLQGATDLEKQLELLLVENQRLKKELKSCKPTDAAAESCSQCPHSQVCAPGSLMILVASLHLTSEV